MSINTNRGVTSSCIINSHFAIMNSTIVVAADQAFYLDSFDLAI